MDQIKIGKFIADCRKNKNLTQEKLAELIGISPQSISKWETDVAVPELSKLVKMAEVFGVSLDALVLGKDDEVKVEEIKEEEAKDENN